MAALVAAAHKALDSFTWPAVKSSVLGAFLVKLLFSTEAAPFMVPIKGNAGLLFPKISIERSLWTKTARECPVGGYKQVSNLKAAENHLALTFCIQFPNPTSWTRIFADICCLSDNRTWNVYLNDDNSAWFILARIKITHIVKNNTTDWQGPNWSKKFGDINNWSCCCFFAWKWLQIKAFEA